MDQKHKHFRSNRAAGCFEEKGQEKTFEEGGEWVFFQLKGIDLVCLSESTKSSSTSTGSPIFVEKTKSQCAKHQYNCNNCTNIISMHGMDV